MRHSLNLHCILYSIQQVSLYCLAHNLMHLFITSHFVYISYFTFYHTVFSDFLIYLHHPLISSHIFFDLYCIITHNLIMLLVSLHFISFFTTFLDSSHLPFYFSFHHKRVLRYTGFCTRKSIDHLKERQYKYQTSFNINKIVTFKCCPI